MFCSYKKYNQLHTFWRFTKATKRRVCAYTNVKITINYVLS